MFSVGRIDNMRFNILINPDLCGGVSMTKLLDNRPKSFHSDTKQAPKPSGVTDADFTYRTTIYRPDLHMHVVVVADTIDELVEKIETAEAKASAIDGLNPSPRQRRYSNRGGAATKARYRK